MKKVKRQAKFEKIKKKNDRKKRILLNKLKPIFKKHLRSLKPKKVKNIQRKSVHTIRDEKVKKEMERRNKFDTQLAKFEEKHNLV